jgi:tRNA(Ile)-lysidine synthase
MTGLVVSNSLMNPSRLLTELRQTAAELGLEGQAVLVGVSGGADSVALLRGLVELRGELRLEVHAAHLNHQLRGAAADADAQWLEELCRSLPAPLTIGCAAVADTARESGRGIEETARDERYRFLELAARRSGCRYVAVAHTADDQAETILHHVLRGTGLAGLSGMPASRELDSEVRLVRPLLGLRRVDVVAYLRALGQTFREDSSNQDDAFTRNRLRRHVLPDLARDFNPQLTDALCRLGRQAADTQAALAAYAAEWLDRVLESETPHESRLKWQPLADRPRHLVREVLALLWRRRNWPRQRMDFMHWERLADIVVHGGASDFPEGLHACRSGRLLIVARTAPSSGGPQ